MNTSHAKTPLAVLWDFGGVILSSPFEAFNRYEMETGLPKDFIRGLNARNPDTNAWAKMERSEVSLDGFVALFEEEARQQGHTVEGWKILQALSGATRPQMVDALRASRRKILVFLSFVMMMVLVSGTVMYVVEGPANGYTSIPTSMYWAISTMTTVGFGDIAPKTDTARAIASLLMLLGWGVLAVPTGIVTAEGEAPHPYMFCVPRAQVEVILRLNRLARPYRVPAGTLLLLYDPRAVLQSA